MSSKDIKVAAIKKLTKELKSRLTNDELLGVLILGGSIFKNGEMTISEVDLMIRWPEK